MKKILLAALLSAAASAGAQDYPTKAINLIVPNPPGGMNQIHAQPLGAIIEKLYKQPAPVLNKPGATAAAGTQVIAVLLSRMIGAPQATALTVAVMPG
jgi:tripartite-type tricarboxylate transporter receptor subunit TctC